MPISKCRNLRAAGIAALTSIGLAAATAAPAAAAECPVQPVKKAFAQWGDSRDYFLAPGGDFEVGLSWLATGAPALSAASDPFALSGAGLTSLRLTGSQSVTTPTLCVSQDHRVMRFVTKAQDKTSRLSVELLWNDKGVAKTDTVGEVPADLYQAWKPSKATPLGDQLPFDAGQVHEVKLRFKLKDAKGDWLVDSVFIDPYMKR